MYNISRSEISVEILRLKTKYQKNLSESKPQSLYFKNPDYVFSSYNIMISHVLRGIADKKNPIKIF